MEIEAVELVAGLLGVGYVFIDNEGSTLGVVGDTLSNLATMTVSIISQSAHPRSDNNVVFIDTCRVSSNRVCAYRIGPNFPKRSNNSSGVTL